MARAQTTEYPADHECQRARLVALDDRLEAAWNELASRSGSPIEGFAWSRACAETVAADRAAALVVGSLAQPVAIAPGVIRPRRLSPLEMIGVAELGEPMDLLYADDAGAARVARALAHSRAVLDLRRVPAGSSALAAIEHAYRAARGVVRVTPAGSCPYIRLDDTWAEPDRRLSPRRRADLRRAQRRAENLGELSWELLSPGAPGLDALLQEAFRVEAAGWKGHAQTALAHDATRAAFYRKYAAAAAAAGTLRLCFLRIGGQAAAMQLAVEVGDRLWLLKIGYDERFARCSPGSLLLRRTIADAAARGLRAYEFLGQSSEWTRVWTRDERDCVRLRAYPLAVPGFGRLATDAASAGRRRFAHAVGRAP